MLTPRQAELLAYIDREIGCTGVCPSYLDMMKALGLASKSGVNRMIVALQRHGYIRRRFNAPRSIEVIRLPSRSSSVQSVLADIVDHLEPELLKLRQDFTIPGGGLDPDMGDGLKSWIETGEALVARARSALSQ